MNRFPRTSSTTKFIRLAEIIAPICSRSRIYKSTRNIGKKLCRLKSTRKFVGFWQKQVAQFVHSYKSVDGFAIQSKLESVDLKNDLDFQQTYRNAGSLQGRAVPRETRNRL